MDGIHSILNRLRSGKHGYLVAYTLSFCLVSILMFWYFPLYHKSFIWQQDGLKQHYNGLLYYSRYLKEIVSGLVRGQGLRIPMWDFSVGYGSDIITTFHYYALGDPLTLLSVLIPLSLMEYFYAFLFFLRAFIGGAGFSLLSLSKGNGRFYTLTGALIYCFSAFGLVLGLMHGIFMVPVCYFPWMIYGIDRIFRGKSPAVFILSTAAAAAANFYFFYMEIFLSVLYIVYRFVTKERDEYGERQERSVYIKDFFKYFIRFLIYGLDAFFLSAVVLLPVLSVMFMSERFAAEKYVPLIYPIRHYFQLIADFMVTRRASGWTLMGYTVAGGFAVLLLITLKNPDKEKKRLKLLFIILTLFLMIPFFGYALNGFAYVVNRWTFAYALLVAMITASCLPLGEKPGSEERNRTGYLLVVLAGLSAFFYFVRNEESLLSMMLLLIMVLILFIKPLTVGRYKAVILGFTLLSFFFNGWFSYSTAEDGMIKEFQAFHEADRNLKEKNPAGILSGLDHSDFYRTEIRGLDTTQNSSIQTGFRGTQFYFSLTSPYISDFINSLYLNCPKDYDYDGVESRAGLEAIAAVRYYIAGEEGNAYVPAGFKKIREEDTPSGHASLYENENALPLGFAAQGMIRRSVFDGERVTGRQNALMTGVVLNDEDVSSLAAKGYRETDFTDGSRDVLKKISADGDIDLSQDSFTVRRNGTVTVTFEGTEDSETWLYFKGLEFEGFKEREKYDDGAWAGLTPFEQAKVLNKNTTDGRPSVSSMMVTLDGRGQIIEFYNPRNDYYCGRKNFLINLGKTGSGEKEAVIAFRESGIYSFDSLEVRSQENESILGKIQDLGKEVMTDTEVNGDQVRGNISVGNDSLLMLSIPYSKGWKAFVDGKLTDLYRADLMYMAVPVEKGSHSILLQYETPFLRTGACLTLAGILLFIVVIFTHKRYNLI